MATPVAGPRPLVVAARGERRGFQVVVRVDHPADLMLRLGSWKGPSRLGPPVIYQEVAVPVNQPSADRPPSNVGLWPDVLVRSKATATRLQSGSNAFWIDVPIPRGARAGRYVLPVDVAVDGRPIRLAATIAVVAATPRPVLATLVELSDSNESDLDLIRLLASFRLRPAEWSFDRKTLRRLLQLQSVVQLPGQTDPMNNGDSLRAAMRLLRSMGAAGRNVAYVADEPSCDDLPVVENAARAARAADRRIRPLVTISPAACNGDAERSLRDVRIFVPTERMATPTGSLGRTRWIYPNNANAGNGFATFAIDDPGVAALLVPWRAGAVGATGVLYWSADRWAEGGNPRENTWIPSIDQEYNGDGVMVYPGLLPSLRLALFREGAEDYDLARCAGTRGRRILRSIAPAPQHLTQSSRAILRARLALARACAS